ncbi:MAG: hypothetical protein J5928_01710 [Firmicutes bacterium]|nr:hypothetical protein [Bacillota bacterium]
MIRVFDTDIARKCGVNAATVASFLWERIYSEEDYKTEYGVEWTRVSQKTMTANMPHMSVKMIANAVKKLKNKGYIKVSKFNDSKFDKTNWYAFTDFGFEAMNKDEE